MPTPGSIPTKGGHAQPRPIGFPEDEADQMLSLISALGVLIPAKFSHDLEARDFDALLTCLEMQAERIRAALDQRAGHA